MRVLAGYVLSVPWTIIRDLFVRQQGEHYMNRIEKLKNDVYSFEELNTLEKNATQLNDSETLELIVISRASKLAKGEKPKPVVDEDGKPLTRRARRQKS
jgi:hypothetical protein